MKALHIDANPGDARLVQKLLKDVGEKVVYNWVKELGEGIQYIKRDKPDIVILDMGLPDSQGLTTLAKLHSSAPEIPIVVVTGLEDEKIAVEAIRLGAQDYLYKSDLAPDLLVRAINHALSRAQLEEALRESEAKYRGVIESAKDGIFIIDEQLRFISVNSSVVGYGGRKPQEYIGKTVFDIFPNEMAKHFAGNLSKVFETGEALQDQVTNRQIDGKEIFESISLSPVKTAAGKTYAIVGIVRDLSEHKRDEMALRESEKKFRILFESSANGILVADAEKKRFTFANPSICLMLGYSEDELLMLGLADIHPKDSLDYVLSEFDAQLRGEKTLSSALPCKRKDGTVFYADVNAAPALIDGRKCVVGFFTDVTERKQAEKEKASLEAQLFQAQKLESVGQLAAGIAHDFNNILTGIIGYTEMAQRSAPGTEFDEKYLGKIIQLSDRAANLVKQLLTFSRQQEMHPVLLDLNSLVNETFDLLKRLIGGNIHLEFNPSPEILTIMADSGQIQQVIMNLAVNARDAIKGNGSITIRTEKYEINGEETDDLGEKAGIYAVLSVSDDGCGFPEELRERIFDPFFTTKEPGIGTGLGLSVVYGIVKEHGGFVDVGSEPGLGSVFKVYLPVSVVNPPKKAKEGILAVEDEEPVLEVIRDILVASGYAFFGTSSPEEAEKIFFEKKDEIGLLLTDVVMPGISGPELYRRLHAVSPDLKALFISGYSKRQGDGLDVEEYKDVFLAKPFTTEELSAKIRGVMASNIGVKK
jgi:PAS domain S-box-containing protein